MSFLRENPLLVEFRRISTDPELRGYHEDEDEEEGDDNEEKDTNDPLSFATVVAQQQQRRTTVKDKPRRVHCVVWNAHVEDSALVKHSVLADRCGCCSGSGVDHHHNAASHSMIQVDANSLVEYCNLTVTCNCHSDNDKDNDHKEMKPVVSIGKDSVVSCYTLQPEESLVVPDGIALQRISFSAVAAEHDHSYTNRPVAAVTCFFAEDDYLVVLGVNDTVHGTFFGQPLQDLLERTGMNRDDLWDADCEESERTFRTARLFPVVDCQEKYQAYYAWLEPFCSSSCSSSAKTASHDWTVQQQESLQQWKNAVRFSATELQESCRAAMRAGISAARRKIRREILPVKQSLYINVLQRALLVVPVSWNETAVSLVVDNYRSTLAWLQEDQEEQQLRGGEQQQERRKANMAARRRLAVKNDVIMALRLLDDVIRITRDEAVTAMAVNHQLSILQSLALAGLVMAAEGTTTSSSTIAANHQDRIARRVRLMISSFVHDRDQFTAVRDFLLLEYSADCPETFEILANATEVSRPKPKFPSKKQLQLQQKSSQSNLQKEHLLLSQQAQQQHQPLSSLPSSRMLTQSRELQDCFSDGELENELALFHQCVEQIAQVLLYSGGMQQSAPRQQQQRQVWDLYYPRRAAEEGVPLHHNTMAMVNHKSKSMDFLHGGEGAAVAASIAVVDSHVRNVDSLISLVATGLLWKI